MWNVGSRLALLALTLLAAGCATPSGELEADPAAEALAASIDESQRRPWNQQEMTALTGDLARAVREVRRAWRREPGFRDPQGPNRRHSHRLDQTLRLLDQRATQLHNRVKAGAGYVETFNIARNIRVLLNDLDMHGRRIMTSYWMTKRVRPAMTLINEIASYYGSAALFDPESLQRTDRPPRTR